MEQFRGRYPVKRQRSVNMDDEISGTFFGRPFSFKGRDILPWLLIVILLSACAYLVDFSVNKWGTPIDLGITPAPQGSGTAFSLINPFLSTNYIIKQ